MKSKLNLKVFNNVLIHYTFFIPLPFSASKFSLFRKLSSRHLFNIYLYGILGFIKNFNKIKVNKNDNVLLIFNIWGSGYHHFLMEVLLKAALYKNVIDNYIILIPKNCPKYILDGLKLLNIDNYIELTHPTFYKKLHIIENPDSGEYYYPHLEIFRNIFIKNSNIIESKRIYISRKNARARKILNEEELEPILLKYNFIILHCENLSLEDQISLFSNSDFLISIHGAGLTNMIFMKENSKIIELFPSKNTNDKYEENLCYLNLAKTLNFNYFKFDCIRPNVSQQFDIADVKIDVKLFENHLNLYIKT